MYPLDHEVVARDGLDSDCAKRDVRQLWRLERDKLERWHADHAQDESERKAESRATATPKDGEDPPPDVVALRNETFQFDSFLGAQTSQETVYERVAAPIVSSVLQGYNGTVFAYGQTGSGKTFSMFGGKSSKEAGIVPRALVHIFKEINEDEAFEYSVTLSYVQLYCELLTDLLSPNGPEDGSSDGVGASVGGAPTSTGPGGHKSLLIREDTKRGIFIEGVKCAAVESAEEAMAMIQEGDEHRVRAATNMNAASSRSHACIILNITKRKCAESAQAGGKKSKVKFGKLILVDLAGSERVKKALGENHSHHGTRFMESKAINLSLSALGNCISALAQRKQHIPYRDAKLTRLLKDSLGGNSMTALVLNVAPHESFASETKSTLTFGQRAMAVQTRVTINEQVDFQALYSSVQASLDHKDDRIHELEIALSKVRIELNDARQQADKAEQERSMASMQLSSLSVSADVADQVGLLQAEHARAVDALRNEFESKISAEKQRASSAQEEWHRIEYELKDEREEHLRTCALLREKQAQLAEVEQSKEDRIAELFEDLKASQERSDAARAEMEAVEAERVRLAAENASMRAELDKGREFQERGLQLMETLTSRVESLEERKRSAHIVFDETEATPFSCSARGASCASQQQQQYEPGES
ncbi:Kinesin-like protein KIN-UA [Hondaea fermentalgiana]|uniref:Kinesin-like protein n=1 Tax=Hondaea fermentalgiana TaxID=2315210 RepID=A0A2R5FYJ8_9STRA|nr:Kinesin-like protein KIN-UA [Hondaea fermentalgiana]|eukprot:GBG23827.1 Kinesin-like protein KIN-UA [Hondaea fermentalgiana]